MKMSKSESTRDELAFLTQAVQYIDGVLSDEECMLFHEELRRSDIKLKLFADLQLQGAMVRSAMRQAAYAIPNTMCESKGGFPFPNVLLAVAGTCLVMVTGYFLVSSRSLESAKSDISRTQMIGASGARFFSELAPRIKSYLALEREYILTGGLIELAFPKGAVTIIESPAVFRVVADDCLAMDSGRCSVYAPKGAEGFRVVTPNTSVVDRGTRFIVSVGENAATEVQMVAGAADVYQNSSDHDNRSAPVHLTDQVAMRFSGTTTTQGSTIPSLPDGYRSSLPDRVVSYEANRSVGGGFEQLTSVTVQRGGQLQTIMIDDLIGVKLIQFRSGPENDMNGHLAGSSGLPSDRLDLLSDSNLNTGIINPGGGSVPLLVSPDSETRGFAVRFDQPVVNGLGPDVVFFELQCKTNPVDGDAFHVSPLMFSESSKSHTVRSYDLTLLSREALPLSNFLLYRFSHPVNSIGDLRSMEYEVGSVSLSFQAIAVGIDLSDLGFAVGEKVEGLFFQDAADDENSIVDPVYIAGLPTLKNAGVNQ